MLRQTVFLLPQAPQEAPQELQMHNPQRGRKMKTFVIGIKANKALHVVGTVMDVTQEGHLVIVYIDDEDEYVVAIFKEWECCMERDMVKGAIYTENLDE